MKKSLIGKLFVMVVALTLVAPMAWAANVKNVIVMVPDGCSSSVQTLARLVKGSELNVDALASGLVRTYMANSVITGSAAAGTAFATGHKTTVRFLGVGPRTDDLLTGFEPTAEPYAPVESILEVAKRHGKGTGLVATSRITHATPAAYACHIDDRGKDNEIIEHMVYNDIDVVFGGGARHLIPSGSSYTTSFGDSWGGKRSDGENLIDELLGRGYAFVDNKDDMNALPSGKVWGMFDDSHMDPDLDRDELHPTQPSIAEMTAKAIDLLSQDTDGFFLMVEGSQVDWAGHANDAAYMAFDFLAFDEAVGVVLDFAKNVDTDTLVMIFPDHNTGALSIGHELSDFPPSYTATSLEAMIDPIKDAKMTIQGLLYVVPSPATAENVRETFVELHGEYWSAMSDSLAQYVADMLNDNGPYGAYYPVAKYLSTEMTDYGWTTQGHTGEDVPLWSYGVPRPVGGFANTELATFAAKAFGFKLKASKAWKEYEDSVLNMDDPANPVAKIGPWSYPIGKDYRIHKNGKNIQYFSDITVWAPLSGKVYIPKR